MRGVQEGGMQAQNRLSNTLLTGSQGSQSLADTVQQLQQSQAARASEIREINAALAAYKERAAQQTPTKVRRQWHGGQQPGQPSAATALVGTSCEC